MLPNGVPASAISMTPSLTRSFEVFKCDWKLLGTVRICHSKIGTPANFEIQLSWVFYFLCERQTLYGNKHWVPIAECCMRRIPLLASTTEARRGDPWQDVQILEKYDNVYFFRLYILFSSITSLGGSVYTAEDMVERVLGGPARNDMMGMCDGADSQPG